MNLIPSELNRRLGDAVRYSVAADRFYIGGKAGFWRLVGIGVIMFGLGAATGFSFYGYSFVSRNSDNSRILASAFSKALADVKLKAIAAGTVHLEPREIALAQNQTISLDSSSRLLLDSSATVRADGEITIEGPTISSPQTTTHLTPLPPSIANFTVFKAFPFNKGTVQTGWIFLTSAQRSPTQQYCYYTEAADAPGRNVMLDIGLDGKLETPKTLPTGFDLASAFSRCIWFKDDGP